MVLYGLLLAAGQSQRFAGDKLLYPLPSGLPIGVAAARCLLSSVEHVVAVIRPGAESLSHLFDAEGVQILMCPDADQGMGASLAWAIQHTPQASGWLVALADMPFIRPATVQQVTTALKQGALLAAPVYRGRRGHPVGFAKPLGKELASLAGDLGAQTIIRTYSQQLVSIATEDSGILQDIDTPADLKNHGPNGDAAGTELHPKP